MADEGIIVTAKASGWQSSVTAGGRTLEEALENIDVEFHDRLRDELTFHRDRVEYIEGVLEQLAARGVGAAPLESVTAPTPIRKKRARKEKEK